jgi:antitoxin (DNA-binding transcriptional repressor) of toxin-antitoxin stability system
MSTVTVRELQKNLKRTLLRVERGETLQITRRRRTVARLTPELAPAGPATKSEPWPDLAARWAKIMALGKSTASINAAQFVIDSRGNW